MTAQTESRAVRIAESIGNTVGFLLTLLTLSIWIDLDFTSVLCTALAFVGGALMTGVARGIAKDMQR